jgi:hypothetical protein
MAVSVTHTASGEPAGSHVMVILEGLTITHLFSRDGLKAQNAENREGILTITLGGHTSTLRWATDKEGNLTPDSVARLKDRMVFLGEDAAVHPLSINVYESDRKTAEGLKTAATAFDKLGGAIGGQIPVYGTIVTAGTTLLSGILQAIAATVDDDVELHVEGAVGSLTGVTSSAPGKIVVARRTAAGAPGIEVELRLEPITPPPAANGAPKTLHLFIDNITFQGSDLLDKRRALLLQTNVGSGDTARARSIRIPLKNGKATFSDIASLTNMPLYSGPIGTGVPYSFVANAVAESDGKAWLELLDRAIALTELVTEKTGTGGAVTDKLRSVEPVVGQVVAEFLPKTRPLISHEGVLLLDGAPAGPQPYRQHVTPNNPHTFQLPGDPGVTITLRAVVV